MKKKRMKIGKILLVCLIFVVAAFACSSGEEGEKKEITAGEAQKEAEGKAEEKDEVKAEDSEETETTIEEQVLIDQDGLKITATGMENDSIWGKGVKLLIENNTDKNLGVGCNALIVNDYMITDLFSQTVAAGKKANEVMDISSTQLEAAGIENIGKIEIYFHVFDGDTYQTIRDFDCVTIETSQYENMDVDADVSEGQELYNQDGVRIVGKYVDEDSIWGTAVLLYLENTSGRNVTVGCDNMSINGFMVSPLFSGTVYDGKKSLDDITIFSSDLEENGIESVEEIEVTFNIFESDTYKTIAETGPITFSAK